MQIKFKMKFWLNRIEWRFSFLRKSIFSGTNWISLQLYGLSEIMDSLFRFIGNIKSKTINMIVLFLVKPKRWNGWKYIEAIDIEIQKLNSTALRLITNSLHWNIQKYTGCKIDEYFRVELHFPYIDWYTVDT